MKPGIEVVVMCRERYSEAIRAIEAIDLVDFGIETKIVVSDNPSKPNKALSDIPSHVAHIIRNPSGSWNWHFNTIVSELEHEWCLITHDDDEILPVFGKVFREHCNNPEVSVVTGLSQIVDHKKGPIFDQGYDNRINAAALRKPAGEVRKDLSGRLFDLGTLFPASAMIIRSSLLQSLGQLDDRFELTADFGLSVLISHESGVVFEGSEPVMNYNLHDNNSVFSDVAAGGIMPDFTITRILLLEKFKELYSESRMTMLMKSVIVSKILATAFGLSQRKRTLQESIRASTCLKRNRFKYLIMMLPIRLGPLAPYVRYKMRKRIGI